MYSNRILASILLIAAIAVSTALVALATSPPPAAQPVSVAQDNYRDPNISYKPINITQQDLIAARQKWEGIRTTNYTMHFECAGWMAFILYGVGRSPCGEWSLNIASGTKDRLISKQWLIGGDVISSASNETVEKATVTGLFDLVGNLLSRTSNGTVYDTDTGNGNEPIFYVVAFNEELGYPESITAFAPPSKILDYAKDKNQIAFLLTVKDVKLLR